MSSDQIRWVDIGARGVQDTRSARLMSATTRSWCWWKWEAPGMKSTAVMIRARPQEPKTITQDNIGAVIRVPTTRALFAGPVLGVMVPDTRPVRATEISSGTEVQ
jgi:hypothetical protein